MSESEAFDCEYLAARKALKVLLAECRDGVMDCFARGREETAQLRAGAGNDAIWFAWHNMAADLMRASLAIADRFLGPPKITHRFTIEHIAADGHSTTRTFAREQVLPFPRLPRLRGRPPRDIASAARTAPSGNRRGAPRGNTNAQKYPRLRECQETCRRYRLLIRRICAAVVLYDAIAAQVHTLHPTPQPVAASRNERRATTPRRTMHPTHLIRMRRRSARGVPPRATGPPIRPRANMSPLPRACASGAGKARALIVKTLAL